MRLAAWRDPRIALASSRTWRQSPAARSHRERRADKGRRSLQGAQIRQGQDRSLVCQTVAELRAHRLRQAEEQLRLGLRPDGDSFVVAQVDGAPLQPRSLTHEWVRVLGKTTLPRIRFHDLRHTHASQMLSAGVHPKVASERLGHSSIGITLDLYSHVMPGMQADAAEQVDVALQAAISSERKAK
ncbi:tyrosine-type recombinase/integrase [Mesorhizobium sp.]|uniref:tyrosine-type recombinase/integrase n=1 Tax=Mesorhizobium sp. TaxID=1871066 RepID=UPI0025EBBB07|nr:tyrosine-type recombinase/integrase [Mesorhizobium sp.]